MKYVWMALRLLLPAAAIVLEVLWLTQGRENQSLLGAGLICLSLSTCLNVWFSRRNRQKEE